MKLREYEILIMALWLLLVSVGAAAQEKKPIVFRNVTVIDMASKLPKLNTTVLISGNRIAEVDGNVKIPKNARVINANGKFLIPGLWDMHVHADEAGNWMFPLFLANGVTGVRDLGSHVQQIAIWRNFRPNAEKD